MEKEVDPRLDAPTTSSATRRRCSAGLEALVERTGADELMLTTMAHAPKDRVRSYELVAEAMELAPQHGEG